MGPIICRLSAGIADVCCWEWGGIPGFPFKGPEGWCGFGTFLPDDISGYDDDDSDSDDNDDDGGREAGGNATQSLLVVIQIIWFASSEGASCSQVT